MDGGSYSPDQSPRYTVRYQDQEARKTEVMGRPFYRAGEKIDGSVIQHCPGGEIMVTDFGKDTFLRDFYEQTLADFKKAQAEGKGYSLPLYFYQAIQARETPDKPIVDGLITGEVQDTLKKKTGLYQRMLQRSNNQILEQTAQLPPLKNEKFSVGNYLALGYGVCRQQAVTLGACMERAINEGQTTDWVKGAEIRANLANPTDGHAWVALLNKNGVTYIYDPAQNYPGPEDLATSHWPYRKGYENHKFGEPGT